jgi:uncharacterized protein YdcH (DUF465 family)
MMDEESLREQLRREHPEFRKLFDEHHRLDEELKEMIRRRVLTPEDEVRRKQLQVEKLHTKDRMEAILREHRKMAAPGQGMQA